MLNPARSGIAARWVRATLCSVLLLAPCVWSATPVPVAADFAQNLLKDPDSPVLGNPNGTVSVVEFFDYRCPFCKAMQPKLQSLLAHDGDVRLVEKDWPVFGGVSVYAAQVAIAAQWQGKYLAVHEALFAVKGEMDQASVRAAAKSAGVDLARLDHDLQARHADLERILNKTHEEALALHLQGTPGFVIGANIIPGSISEADLANLVRKARPAK